MHWIDWVVVGLFTLGSMSVIYMVGKPRTPITPAQASFTLLIQATIVIAILFTHGYVERQ